MYWHGCIAIARMVPSQWYANGVPCVVAWDLHGVVGMGLAGVVMWGRGRQGFDTISSVS
jgi:hypothetical protein